MIKFKDFVLIKRLKDEGLSKQQAIKESGLKAWSVRKYWNYSEEEFRDADAGKRRDDPARHVWREGQSLLLCHCADVQPIQVF